VWEYQERTLQDTQDLQAQNPGQQERQPRRESGVIECVVEAMHKLTMKFPGIIRRKKTNTKTCDSSAGNNNNSESHDDVNKEDDDDSEGEESSDVGAYQNLALWLLTRCLECCERLVCFTNTNLATVKHVSRLTLLYCFCPRGHSSDSVSY
jgi:hypothetical protein